MRKKTNVNLQQSNPAKHNSSFSFAEKHYAYPNNLTKDKASTLPNILVHGDNLCFLKKLQEGQLAKEVQTAGGIKLIYIDPPFAVGSDFYMPVGDTRQKAYTDCWPSKKDFLDMLEQRVRLMHSLLANDGSFFLHCDWRISAHIRLMLDDIFGEEQFLGEVIWHYTGGGRAKRYFSRKHDTIFHYAKGKKWTFNLDAVRVPYKTTSNYAKDGIVSKSGKKYLPNPLGTPIDDVWDIPMVNPLAKERLGYPTQKPEMLLERIILAASNPGDIVADFFCGSGTTLACASKLGRRWLGSDTGVLAIHTTRQRLLETMQKPPLAAKADCTVNKTNFTNPQNCINQHTTCKTSGTKAQQPSCMLICTDQHICLETKQVVLHTKTEGGKFYINLLNFIPNLPISIQNQGTAPLQDKKIAPHNKSSVQSAQLQANEWHKFVVSWSVGSYKEGDLLVEKTFEPIWCSKKQGEYQTCLEKIKNMEILVQLVDIFGQVYYKKV